MPRTKVATIYRGGPCPEYMDLYDDGCIGRSVCSPSGQWKITGAVTRNNFGRVIKRWTLEEILADPGAIPWLHANGKQKTFVTDLDHGTHREWRSPTCRIYADTTKRCTPERGFVRGAVVMGPKNKPLGTGRD